VWLRPPLRASGEKLGNMEASEVHRPLPSPSPAVAAAVSSRHRHCRSVACPLCGAARRDATQNQPRRHDNSSSGGSIMRRLLAGSWRCLQVAAASARIAQWPQWHPTPARQPRRPHCHADCARLRGGCCCYRSLPLGGSLTSLTRDHPAAVTPSLYVTDTVCVGRMYPTIALP
jgi:hypothetical protein